MATTTSTHLSTPRPTTSSAPPRRKKDTTQRPEIWTSLLRQTQEAQARHRTSSLSRHLIVCGGSPDDQKDFVERFVARPPPAQPAGRGGQSQAQKKGEAKLRNRFAVGYGHVALFSPPQQSSAAGGGAGLLAGEAEEAARCEVHTFPAAEAGYEIALRGLLRRKVKGVDGEEGVEDDKEGQESWVAPGVTILLSWKQPWTFLSQLRRWMQLLARALMDPSAGAATRLIHDTPLDILHAHDIKVTVVLQHTEFQESLLRENYKEEDFDLISQTIRTTILPLSAALVYTSSPGISPPIQHGSPLTEIQKVVYTSLGLDVNALQAKRAGSSSGQSQENKESSGIAPKHNVVDRMAIVVPAGWDSVGKIRLLSETFSPEAAGEGWIEDLNVAVFPTSTATSTSQQTMSNESDTSEDAELQATGGAEEATYFSSSKQPSPLAGLSPHPSPPQSPSKTTRSAIAEYEAQIQDPNAHKATKPPTIEVQTTPHQQFLSEVRDRIKQYEHSDPRSRARNEEPADGDAGKLGELGEVSINVGGVSYNAEAAVERLRRPQATPGAESPSAGRTTTPRPARREREDSSKDTPTGKGDIPTDKLEEYFASLMKRGGGGGGSGHSTPAGKH